MAKKTEVKMPAGTMKTVPQPQAAKSATTRPMSKSEYGSAPTVEDIRRRAYEIYLERGGEPGGQLTDWLQAERELLVPAHV